MRTNPFSDALDFLTQGEWTSYVFALLALASVVIAAFGATQVSARFYTRGIGWPDSVSAHCGGSSPCGNFLPLTLITPMAPVACATGWVKW
jgi:hypothetical protein